MIASSETSVFDNTAQVNGSCKFVWRRGVAAAGAVLLLIGGLTLIAWGTGNVEYAQIDPNLSPLHYNAALALLVGFWNINPFYLLIHQMYRYFF